MKKLMTISAACLFVFALASCGGDKKPPLAKDNVGWSNALTKECIDSSMAEMNIDEEGLVEAILSINPNIELNQLANCECMAAEKTFPNVQSYSEIEKEIEKDSTKTPVMMELMFECSDDFNKAFTTLMWDQIIFSQLAYGGGEAFAECIIEQAKEKYTLIDLMKMGQSAVQVIAEEFMDDCEGFLPE